MSESPFKVARTGHRTGRKGINSQEVERAYEKTGQETDLEKKAGGEYAEEPWIPDRDQARGSWGRGHVAYSALA